MFDSTNYRARSLDHKPKVMLSKKVRIIYVSFKNNTFFQSNWRNIFFESREEYIVLIEEYICLIEEYFFKSMDIF